MHIWGAPRSDDDDDDDDVADVGFEVMVMVLMLVLSKMIMMCFDDAGDGDDIFSPLIARLSRIGCDASNELPQARARRRHVKKCNGAV